MDYREMIELKITIPKEMYSYLSIDGDRTELERNAMLLYPYIKNLTISHGKVAEILGISKWELITLYNNMGLPYLEQDITDVEEDMETYRKYRKGILNNERE